MAAWFQTVSSHVVFERPFVTIREDEIEDPSGETIVRAVVELDDAVGVLPLFDDGTVVLVRQYRHPFGRDLLEIPAGKLDIDGEPVEDAGRRELAEEVGLAAASLRHLLTFANSAGGSTERTHLYVAGDLTELPRPDGFEPKAEEAHMEVVRVPLADAVAAVNDGTITDAKTVIALLLVDRN